MNSIEVQNRILNDAIVLLDAREQKTGWEWIQERAALTEGEPQGLSALSSPARATADPSPSVSAVQMEMEL